MTLNEIDWNSPVVWVIAGVGVAGFILGLVAVRVLRWWRRRRAERVLRDQIVGSAVDHLAQVVVPDGNGGGLHLDWVLLTPRGIVILDIRDIAGNLFGSDQMDEWTVMNGAKRSTFINPQNALYDRVAAVRLLAGEIPVDGRVVFTRRGKFPKGLPRYAVMIDALASEFPILDRASAASATERFQESWQRLRAQLLPSTMSNPRAIAGL